MTGAELKAHRKAAGLTQTAIAQKAGVCRDTVSYWERKTQIDLRGWAVRRILKVLGVAPDAGLLHQNARARGWGLSSFREKLAKLDADVEGRLAHWHDRKRAHEAKRRIVCGAKTRKGEPCRNKSESGKRRCKFHGGMSTGPRTEEGRARIAEAQRARWAKRSCFRPSADRG